MATTFCTPINNARSTLTTAHTAGDGQLVVANGALFGSPSASAPVRVTAVVGGNIVILKVTGRTSNTLTGVTAIEGTTDISIPSGEMVSAYITAGAISDLHTAVNTLEGGFFLASKAAATASQRAVFGNGVSKPLSGFYASLAAAQVDYPHATATTNELDWAILQGAINSSIGAGDPTAVTRVALSPVWINSGSYLIDQPLVIRSVMGYQLLGSGIDQVQLRPTQAMAVALDFDGITYGTFGGFTVNATATSFTVDTPVHLHWGTGTFRSTSGCTLDQISVRNTRFINGIGIGIDNANQVDCTLLRGITIGGNWTVGEATFYQYGVRFGNNTSGNNVDNWLHDAGVTRCRYGVAWMGSCGGLWGGQFGHNGTDFTLGSPTGQITIDNLRSEESNRLYEGSTGAAVLPVTLRDITWEAGQIAADGRWIRVTNTGTFLIQNVRCGNPGAVTPKVQAGVAGNNPVTVVCIGLAQKSPIATGLETSATNVTFLVASYQELDASSTVISTVGYWTNAPATVAGLTSSGGTVQFSGGDVVTSGGLLTTGATSGFTYLPTCAGTPTGIPVSHTGTIPWVYDTSNNIPYFYNGGWRQVLTPPVNFGGSTSINAAGEMGIGTTPFAGIKLWVNDTETALSGGNERNTYITSLINPVSNSSAVYNTLYVQPSTQAANTSHLTGQVVGISSIISHAGQGTLSSGISVYGSSTVTNATVGTGVTQATVLNGVRGNIGHSGSGIVSSGYGVFGAVSVTGTGTLTFGYGFHADVPAGTGPITYNHGLYIANQARAGVTNAYGIRVTAQAGATTTYAILTEGGRVQFQAGDVVLSGAALTTNATTGFTYLPSCVGTPTGIPTTYTGTTPLVYDTTNNLPYIYNGGWKGLSGLSSNNSFTGSNTFVPSSSVVAVTTKANGTDNIQCKDIGGVVRTSIDENGYAFVRPFTFVLSSIVTGTDLTNWLLANRNGKLVKWNICAKTAPTGSSIILDILKSSDNGSTFTSLWVTNPSNRPTLTVSNKVASGTAFDTATILEGELLRIDVIQVGSTIAGANMTCQLLSLMRNT